MAKKATFPNWLLEIEKESSQIRDFQAINVQKKKNHELRTRWITIDQSNPNSNNKQQLDKNKSIFALITGQGKEEADLGVASEVKNEGGRDQNQQGKNPPSQ